MTMKRKKGYFSISAVAKMFSVHQQTIRLYEKEGLITPKRSEGNTRMFSEEDVDKLEQIIYLTHQLGVNLAGVDQVLKLQKKLEKMQSEMNKLFHETQQDLNKTVEETKKTIKKNAKDIVNLQAKKTRKQIPSLSYSTEEPGTVDIDQWEIEYEEE